MQPNKNIIFRTTKSTLLTILSGMRSQTAIDMIFCTLSKPQDFAFLHFNKVGSQMMTF